MPENCGARADALIQRSRKGKGHMKSKPTPGIAAMVALVVLIAVAVLAQDKSTLQIPEGLAFSDFKGYESWQVVSVSHPAADSDGNGEVLNVIVGNPVMIEAYASGIPGNGRPFPDGAKAVKIQYIPKKSAEAPTEVAIPDKLRNVAFMMKDSKRFAKSSGWGYGVFNYDSVADRFTPSGKGSSCGVACHSIVKTKDFVFTAYQKR
jgi:hypothetical protein